VSATTASTPAFAWTRASTGLDELVAGVRQVVNKHADWRRTARLAAHELERHLPSPALLTAEQRKGGAEAYRTTRSTPGLTGVSIVALVWRPRQMSAIHDHVTWCAFGVIQGVEHEELFRLDEERGCLVEAGTSTNHACDVSGFANP
jgi:predicted metal-dependent enzyme (double-stranded beta helix superfamily)